MAARQLGKPFKGIGKLQAGDGQWFDRTNSEEIDEFLPQPCWIFLNAAIAG
jgi:hypothetical protein